MPTCVASPSSLESLGARPKTMSPDGPLHRRLGRGPGPAAGGIDLRTGVAPSWKRRTIRSRSNRVPATRIAPWAVLPSGTAIGSKERSGMAGSSVLEPLLDVLPIRPRRVAAPRPPAGPTAPRRTPPGQPGGRPGMPGVARRRPVRRPLDDPRAGGVEVDGSADGPGVILALDRLGPVPPGTGARRGVAAGCTRGRTTRGTTASPAPGRPAGPAPAGGEGCSGR